MQQTPISQAHSPPDASQPQKLFSRDKHTPAAQRQQLVSEIRGPGHACPCLPKPRADFDQICTRHLQTIPVGPLGLHPDSQRLVRDQTKGFFHRPRASCGFSSFERLGPKDGCQGRIRESLFRVYTGPVFSIHARAIV